MRRHAGAAVFLLALAMHLALLLDGPRDPTWRFPIVDARTYHDFAGRLLDGRYSPNTPFYQPPAFGYLLAGIYAVSGRSMLAARLFLAVLGSLTAVFSMHVARRLFGGRSGWLAGLLVAFQGPLLFFNLQFLPAGLAALLNVVLLWLLLRAADLDRPVNWLTAGACAGLTAVTVPNVLLFLACVPLWAACLKYNAIAAPDWRGRMLPCARAAVGRGLLLLAGFAVAVAPVTWHNYLASGRFTLISHNGGLNFYIGNNPDADATIAIRPGFGWENLDKLPMRAGIYCAVDADRHYYGLALRYIIDQPGHFLKNLLRKIRQVTNARELPRNVDIYVLGGYYRWLRPLVWHAGGFGFPFGLLFPLACWGMATGVRRNPLSWLPAMFALVYAFSVALFFVAARYRVVFVPALCVYAAYALDWRQWRGRFGWRPWPMAVILAAGLWCNTPMRAPTDHIPFRAEMFNFIGLQQMRESDYRAAAAMFEQALAVAPGYAPAYNSLGSLHVRQGDPAAARDAYLEAVRLDAGYAEAYGGLGRAYEALDRPDLAESAYRRAIALSPATAMLYVRLGRVLYHRRQRAEAAAMLRQAISLDITAEEAYGLLAWILSTAPEDDLRDGAAALQYVNFLIRWRGADDPMRVDTLAAAYAENGFFDAAADAAERAAAMWRRAGRDDIAARAAQRAARYRRHEALREDR